MSSKVKEAGCKGSGISKKKKIILISVLSALAVIIAVLLILLIGAYTMFKPQLDAIGTIEKLDDGIYSMTYAGDYGFDEFLARGGAASDEEVAAYLTEFLSHGFYKVSTTEQTPGCSTVQADREGGGYLFGRNFDWDNGTIMIVRTVPDNGYASVSTCNLDFLGFGDDFLPDGGFMNELLSLAAVYVPLDGINEKGLCIADLTIDTDEGIAQDNGKPDLTTTTAIRLILDRAATVDDAIRLLREYDMHGSIGSMHHLAISDNSGKSVVVEYIDNELTVTETKVVTNFFLAEGDHRGIGSEQSMHRYEILEEWLYENGIANAEQMCGALQSVSKTAIGDEYEMTVWSIVFDQQECTATYYFRENYDRSIVFKVKDD